MKAFTTEVAGDRAVIVRFASRPTRDLSGMLIALAEAARLVDGVVDAVPGHRTVLVETDPGAASSVEPAIRSLRPVPRTTGWTQHVVDVAYDGPDLEWASSHLGMSVAEIIRMHAATTYDVRLIGSPGFVYLSQAPAQLHMPRRDEPRQLVPRGSVGIGGKQTGIYACAMPGGWRILGTTSSLPYLRPGDRVRFRPA
ncbi:MAG: allophanate hydrolase subunit 1 [Actinomycetota bacterium]|nr:allophanate hydrolase subunit 1 [Actinomycetota bacterium]